MANINKNREIDIVGIIKKVLADKILLLKFIIISAFIGVVVALNTAKEYTTTVVLAPEMSGNSGISGNLGDLASMVGINLNSSGGGAIDAIYPEIYPEVLASSDFIINLFDVNVQLEKNTVIRTYYDHLLRDAKIPFWSYPRIWISTLITKDTIDNKKINPFHLTKEQTDICETIRKRISCIVDKKTAIITISVTDQDRIVSATIADTIQNRLKEYITLYRTKKARNDLAYTKELYDEAKNSYKQAQKEYASYADSYTDVTLESYKTKRDELENELQLRYNIYNQVTQQLQIAQARVQERTPVFTIVQRASVPFKASSMPRSFIVILYVFLGIIADALWITILKDYIVKRRNKIKL